MSLDFHFVIMKIIFLNSIINNNLPPAWSSGISGDGKQVYYKSWPKSGCVIAWKAIMTVEAVGPRGSGH